MSQPLKKPGYSMSRRQIWASFWLAWAIIVALTVGALKGSEQAVAFAGIVVPSLVLLIAALLGIHRAFGSADMRTIATQAPAPDDKLEA